MSCRPFVQGDENIAIIFQTTHVGEWYSQVLTSLLTLGRFRHILEENGIQQKLFAQVVQRLTEKGLMLRKGTIVDSTIIEAPSSTKNKK